MLNTIRRGFTLLEVIIAGAIFAGVLALVATTIHSATQAKEMMASKADVVNVSNAVVTDLAEELRYASISNFGWTKAPPIITYTYRVASRLDKTGIHYEGLCDRELVYNQTAGTLTRTKKNFDDPLLTPESMVIATNIVGPTVPADPAYPDGGFCITKNGNLLELYLRIRNAASFSATDGREWEARQAAVYLRSALALGDGLKETPTNSGSQTGAPVDPSLQPPVITSAKNASGADGTYFGYQITATNSPTKYGVTGSLPNGVAINTGTGLISGSPKVAQNQTSFPVTISASNAAGSGNQSLDLTFTVAAGPTTNIPVVTGDSATASLGQLFSFQINATNMTSKFKPVGYVATGLPSGVGYDAKTGLISGTPTQTGTFTVSMSATNGDGTGSDKLVLTVPTPPPPATPVVSGGVVSATLGLAFVYQVKATNMTVADQPATPAYKASPLPPGLTFDTTAGAFGGMPTLVGTYTVALSATNSGGTGTATLIIDVGAAVNPYAPVVSGATVAATTGQLFSYKPNATYMSPPQYGKKGGWSSSGLPAGLGINADTGSISGTPTTPGSYTVKVTATNDYGSGTNYITIDVSGTPIPGTPVVTSGSTSTQQNSAFTYQIVATNMTASDSPIGYNAAVLPAGLTVDTATGVISGKPTASGSYVITLSARNAGGTGTGSLSLVVIAVPPPAVPVVSSGSASGMQGSAFSYQVQATNMTGTYSPYSYAASGLPAGLSISASTGLISGTPTMGGNSTVTITATNNQGTGTNTVSLAIASVTPPSVTGGSATGTTTVAFSYQISATNMGANNNPVGYSATGLPAGLSVSASTGLISGTPTTAGTSTVTLKATNAGGSGTATLTITIAAYVAPVITFQPTKVTAANGANVSIDGSKITVVPPSGYTLGTVSVNATDSSLHYTISSNAAVNGKDVNLSGIVHSGASVTVTASATSSSGGSAISGTYTMSF